MRNRRRNFTLVELLVVIGIIAILAGMLMAGIMYAPAKAQKAKAQAEITTLVNAIKQYESAYGVLPIPYGSDDKLVLNNADGSLDSDSYKNMIAILQAEDSLLTGKNKKLNKRNSKFLDIQGNDAGTYTDPWGNEYNVALDGNYDGKIVTSDVHGVNATSNTYRFSVIVWSKGHDRKSSSTTTSSQNEDNVYSFPTTWSSDNGHSISK